jgi:GNAT superfamily N-acetyltransferase
VAVAYPIEAATERDLAALGAERIKQGWHPSLPLLRALMKWEGGKIFVLREGALDPASATPQAPIATTSALAAGPVGVVGNVIVREDFRGRGLSHVVMDAAVAWMRERGVRWVLLDATRQGRPLYTKMGFVGVDTSYYAWAPLAEVRRAELRRLAGGVRAECAAPKELARVAWLDAHAFGGDRMGLLARELEEPGAGLYRASDAQGEVTGYLIARAIEAPRQGLRVGPWVARDQATAAALLDCALGEDEPWRAAVPLDGEEGWRLTVNLPGSNGDALALLRAIGVHVEEDDLIMRLDLAEAPSVVGASGGRPCTPEVAAAPPVVPAPHPEWVYAWIAPMVF